MNNGQIAQVLDAIGQLLEFKDENPFKIRAYHNAARAIESFNGDIAQVCRDKKLCEIPGIGKAIEEKITELLTTGTLGFYEEPEEGNSRRRRRDGLDPLLRPQEGARRVEGAGHHDDRGAPQGLRGEQAGRRSRDSARRPSRRS